MVLTYFTNSVGESDGLLSLHFMTNIFDNAGFGDKFITRKGECAIFVKSNPTNVSLATFLYEDGKTRWIRRDIGRYTTFMGSTFKKETEWDIISRWIDKP